MGRDDELGPGAVVVDAHHLQIEALLGVAADDARRAYAVSASGVDRHSIADGPDLRYVRAPPLNRPGAFVAGGDDVQRRLHAAFDDMHIGEADPAEGDLDEHLTGAGLRNRHVHDGEHAGGLRVPGCPHCRCRRQVGRRSARPSVGLHGGSFFDSACLTAARRGRAHGGSPPVWSQFCQGGRFAWPVMSCLTRDEIHSGWSKQVRRRIDPSCPGFRGSAAQAARAQRRLGRSIGTHAQRRGPR